MLKTSSPIVTYINTHDIITLAQCKGSHTLCISLGISRKEQKRLCRRDQEPKLDELKRKKWTMITSTKPRTRLLFLWRQLAILHHAKFLATSMYSASQAPPASCNKQPLSAISHYNFGNVTYRNQWSTEIALSAEAFWSGKLSSDTISDHLCGTVSEWVSRV